MYCLGCCLASTADPDRAETPLPSGTSACRREEPGTVSAVSTVDGDDNYICLID